MIKKTIVGLYLSAAVVLTANLFALWQELHQVPDPRGGLEDLASRVTTAQFQPARRSVYPQLFDVEILSSSNAKGFGKVTAAGKRTSTSGIETPEGMRLKAIFTSREQRLALVEPPGPQKTQLLEVREADLVSGYLVKAVAATYITLQRQGDEEPFRLVLFDPKHDKTPEFK